jgi:hypothetical protein
MSRRKKTQDEFLEQARAVHGDKLDFGRAVYVGALDKVVVGCLQDPEHGEFSATANDLLQGKGCRKCANEAKKKSPEQFLREVEGVHGGKLDFSKAEYVNNRTKVKVSCLQNADHGNFSATPSHLLSGRGCPKCAIESKANARRKDPEQFLREVEEIHAGKLDFSNVKYVNSCEKVKVSCLTCCKDTDVRNANRPKARTPSQIT